MAAARAAIKNTANGLKTSFAGWMLYNRFWFDKDKHAITIGGGQMNNPGGYLTLLPPINGADAISGSPYFTENFGQAFKMWDATITYQVDAQDLDHLVGGGWLSPLGLCRIGRAATGLRLPAATTALRQTTCALTASLPRRYRVSATRHRRDSLLREMASLRITRAAPLQPRAVQRLALAGQLGIRI